MRQNLISARKNKRLTQKMLGQMVGLNQQSISHLELGRMDARRVTWLKLAKILGSTLEHLSRDDAALH